MREETPDRSSRTVPTIFVRPLPTPGTRLRSVACALLSGAAIAMLCGCEVDSFFDPSRTGRFQEHATMIPILDRIDVVEREESPWGETTGVIPEDLLPNDLTYVLAPGDFVTVEVYEGLAAEQWRVYSRRIDAAGNFRIPELGDLRAAGRTVQQFEDHVADELGRLVVAPRVHVNVEEGVAFTYTIHGHLAQPGLFTLRKADLRLNEALASVGGVPSNAERVYVIRQIRLTEELLPRYERPGDALPPGVDPDDVQPDAPVDVEELIEQLEDRPRRTPGGDVEPGMFSSPDRATWVDVDDLVPVRVSDREVTDVDEIRNQAPPQPRRPVDEIFIYIEERGEWVRTTAPETGQDEAAEPRAREQPQVRAAAQQPPSDPLTPPNARQDDRRPERLIEPPFPGEPTRPVDEEPPARLLTERVIEIPYDRLLTDSSYDIVVRPNDRIYVEGPEAGLVYISGEIARPGVYEMPQTGRLTLSRLVAAAGDLGPVAIPSRVDLTRMVGADREATLRLNLAAIRRRTEPDLFLKANDHIIIGTSWYATPLAVIRNGFRATYGFGFLLDRNFGNDVFGAPPGSRF